MGKLTSKDAQSLKESGILSKKALDEMEKSGHVSKGKTAVRRFMKTADGKMVEPRLYFRGGKNTTPSKRMVTFIAEYSALLDKYATTQTKPNSK
jgi:hypothetical protein